MGWLDHSTNNIILDAVLTDYGRQRLATANSTFKIRYFSLGDDEVDYRLVKRYGRTVGKEKIEKNTPIFEALTNPSIALKHKLIGREHDGTAVSTVYLPVLRANTSTIALDKANRNTSAVKIDLYFGSATGAGVPPELIQTVYRIKVSDRFFTLDSASGGKLTPPDIARNQVNAGDPNRIATYTFMTDTNTRTSFSFNVTMRNIDNTTLSVYGKRIDSTSSIRQITSYLTVIGERHGPTLNIPITYQASLA